MNNDLLTDKLLNEILCSNSIKDDKKRESSINDEDSVLSKESSICHSIACDSCTSGEVAIIHVHKKAENSTDLLHMCGDTGIWQVMIYLLGSLGGFNCAIQNFIYTFIADPPPHWCSLPVINEKYSGKYLKELLIPKDQLGAFEKCFQYRYKINERELIVDQSQREQCNTTKDYEPVNFGETIASEWNLVCNNSHWLSTVQASYMFGVLVGSVFFGIWSDKFGRKKTIWIASFLFFISAHFVALSPNFVTLLIFRFLVGVASPGVYSTSFILVVEVTGAKRRALAGSFFSLPFSIGYTVLPIIAYFIRDWRNLQFVCSCLTPLLLLTWWYLPESPRWLLLQGRAAEAENIFRTIAHMNGKTHELPTNFSELVAKVAAAKKIKVEKTCLKRWSDYNSAVFQLVKTPRLRFRTIAMSISFAAISLIYYGISIDSTNLGFDKYLFTFLCGLFEIPSDLMTPFIIASMGRRVAFSGMLLLCGSLLLVSILLPTGSGVTIVLAIFAQLFVAADSTLSYLYCAELFPTVLRSYGFGVTSMIGRTGAIVVPYIVDLITGNHKQYPTIIFGAAALIAGSIALFLPETKNKKLPETIDDIECS